MDCGPCGARNLCQWTGCGADCGAGYRFHQCDDWIAAEDFDFSFDPRDPGAVLACHQRVDAGVGFGSGTGIISGARILGGVYRGDSVEPGERSVEVDRVSDQGQSLVVDLIQVGPECRCCRLNDSA